MVEAIPNESPRKTGAFIHRYEWNARSGRRDGAFEADFI